MNIATAVAQVVNTIAREEFEAYGLELNAQTRRTYLPTAASIHAHVAGPRRVVASTTGDRFDYLASDALDKAYAALADSPYEVPEGIISRVGPSTWEMTW